MRGGAVAAALALPGTGGSKTVLRSLPTACGCRGYELDLRHLCSAAQPTSMRERNVLGRSSDDIPRSFASPHKLEERS